VQERFIFNFAGMVLGLSLLTSAPVYAFDWADLWSTAEQRAARQLENQQYDELIEKAPDANWRGVGEYRKGEYTAAANSFSQLREQAEQAGIVSDAQRAMYNQANAHILEEKYQDAISLLDELLESNPQHDSAQHNRDIAQQLLELQEQQQQEQEKQQQDSGEQGEQGEQSDEDQSDSKDQQNQQPGDGERSDDQDAKQDEAADQEENPNNQSPEQQANGQSQSDDEGADEQSAQQRAEQDAAAAAAMQAEREQQAGEQQPENANAEQAAEAVAPLTEREQANEQWLRQIPDDPVGLLQRKLQNRHLTDFPKVVDSDEPW